jgi:alpha-glucosidase
VNAAQPESLPSAEGDREWWRGAVIYQIYPRSFQDSNGDGIGDLPGITRRLGYVASLGVDAIWLSPFFTSPMKDFGYDVSDFCDVDPMFGTLDDFKAMLAEAHRLGLKVIIDQVLSHTSDRHPWFVESRSSRDNPYADWYVWADPKPDGTPPNNWLSVFGGPAWEWDSRRRQYYLHNFLIEQPDLNHLCPAMQEALFDTLRFWLDLGVDGFRFDTVNFLTHDRELRDNPPIAPGVRSVGISRANPYSMQDHIHDKSRPENIETIRKIRAVIDEYENRATVGEIGDSNRSLELIAAYTQGRDRLNMCYAFDFLSPQFDAGHVRETLAAFEEIAHDGWGCWSFSNHDVERHVSRWRHLGVERERFARFTLALLLALRGSVSLYQGEELGLPEAHVAFEDLQDPYGIRFWPDVRSRDGCRTPMAWEHAASHGGFTDAPRPWLPVAESHLPLAVDAQENDPHAVLAFYRRMLAFRRAHPALKVGDFAFIDTPDDVVGFRRTAADERIVALFNFAHDVREVDLSRLGRVEELDHPVGGVAVAGSHVRLGGFSIFFGRMEG